MHMPGLMEIVVIAIYGLFLYGVFLLIRFVVRRLRGGATSEQVARLEAQNRELSRKLDEVSERLKEK